MRRIDDIGQGWRWKDGFQLGLEEWINQMDGEMCRLRWKRESRSVSWHELSGASSLGRVGKQILFES